MSAFHESFSCVWFKSKNLLGEEGIQDISDSGKSMFEGTDMWKTLECMDSYKQSTTDGAQGVWQRSDWRR